ncbi:hypothetical protein CHUAL_011826 [Chamberlinius hualienensis]
MTLFSVVGIFLMFLVPLSTMSSDCLYGWQWSENLQNCVVGCNSNVIDDKSNIYCRLNELQGVKTSMNISENLMIMSQGKSVTNYNFSSCYRLTLPKGIYNVKDNGLLYLGEYYMPLTNYTISNATGSVTFCYPLSPQFFNCDHDITPPGQYRYLDYNRTVKIISTSLTAYMGDFDITSSGHAVTCKQNVTNNISVVNYYSVPRCNYLTLMANQYEIQQNGSLYIYSLRKLINDPVYTIFTNGFTQVCYPLAISFINCPFGLQTLHTSSYYFNVDYTLTVLVLGKVYLPDSFFLTSSRRLVICYATDVHHSAGTILYLILIVCYLVSSFALLMTLIIRRRDFFINVHAKCMFCHLVCLIIMYACQGIQLISIEWQLILCCAVFVFQYYFCVAMVLWLNVIAYDIWRRFKSLPCSIKSFRSTNSIRMSSNCGKRWKSNETLLFIYYNIYVWGMALLLSLVLSLFYLVPNFCDMCGLACPQPGPSCWFYSSEAFLIFYGAPLCCITIVNMVFSVLTVVSIHRCSAGTEIVNRKSKQQIFRVSVKIFAITSICWILDFCFFVISGIAWYFYFVYFITMGITSMQGIIISVVFCSTNSATRQK